MLKIGVFRETNSRAGKRGVVRANFVRAVLPNSNVLTKSERETGAKKPTLLRTGQGVEETRRKARLGGFGGRSIERRWLESKRARFGYFRYFRGEQFSGRPPMCMV